MKRVDSSQKRMMHNQRKKMEGSWNRRRAAGSQERRKKALGRTRRLDILEAPLVGSHQAGMTEGEVGFANRKVEGSLQQGCQRGECRKGLGVAGRPRSKAAAFVLHLVGLVADSAGSEAA